MVSTFPTSSFPQLLLSEDQKKALFRRRQNSKASDGKETIVLNVSKAVSTHDTPPSTRQRTASIDHTITLSNGENFVISPIALAMGSDPRHSEEKMLKLNKILSATSENPQISGNSTSVSIEAKPQSVTVNRRRQAKPIVLEVDASSARIPGLSPTNNAHISSQTRPKSQLIPEKKPPIPPSREGRRSLDVVSLKEISNSRRNKPSLALIISEKNDEPENQQEEKTQINEARHEHTQQENTEKLTQTTNIQPTISPTNTTKESELEESQEMIESFKTLIDKFEMQLQHQEESFQKRLEIEIKKREEVEKRLKDKTEECFIMRIEREIHLRENAERKNYFGNQEDLENLLKKEIERSGNLQKLLLAKEMEITNLTGMANTLSIPDQVIAIVNEISNIVDDQEIDFSRLSLEYSKLDKECNEFKSMLRVIETLFRVKLQFTENFIQQISTNELQFSTQTLQEEMSKFQSELKALLKWIGSFEITNKEDFMKKPFDLTNVPHIFRVMTTSPTASVVTPMSPSFRSPINLSRRISRENISVPKDPESPLSNHFLQENKRNDIDWNAEAKKISNNTARKTQLMSLLEKWIQDINSSV